MGRRCLTCGHEDRDRIERAYAGGASIRRIASQHQVSEASLRRHVRDHLRPELAAALALERQHSAADVLQELRAAIARELDDEAAALEARDRARTAAAQGWPAGLAFRLLLRAIETAGRCRARLDRRLELLAELRGALDRRPVAPPAPEPAALPTFATEAARHSYLAACMTVLNRGAPPADLSPADADLEPEPANGNGTQASP